MEGLGATGDGEPTQSRETAREPRLLLTGLVANPGEIMPSRLHKLRTNTLVVTFASPRKAVRQRAFRGVWLIDVLHQARLPTDRRRPLAALRLYVVASAHDGAQVVFSLGELDRNLGAAEVLLSWSADGQDLDDFRLVVGSDRLRRRSINGLARLDVCAPAAGIV